MKEKQSDMFQAATFQTFPQKLYFKCFLKKGYPLEVIQSNIRALQLQTKKEPVFGPKSS